MSEHFNGLRPDEAERLAMLAEECGEVVQVIGKILRHGYESKHPAHLDGPTNRDLLAKECADVMAVLKLMANAGDAAIINGLPGPMLKQAMERKLKYAHHQRGPDE